MAQGLNRRGIGWVAAASLVGGVVIAGMGAMAIGAAVVPFAFGLATFWAMRDNPRAVAYGMAVSAAISILAAIGNA